MKLYNPFKNKIAPIDYSNYNWSFQHVSGGMCLSKSLRINKPVKPIYCLLWLGWFKFKIFKLYKTLPKNNEPINPNLYSAKFNFSPEFLNDLQKL